MFKRGFDLDLSCKLYLPFYRYGAEQTRIVDMSGNENHGVITGSVPYPGNPVMTGVGSTFNWGDFTATRAFFWSSLDPSALAGRDDGYTPHFIELTDAAGKKATGYIAGVGAGETLGDETITGWTNGGGGYPYSTFISSGKDITSAVNVLNILGDAYQIYPATVGQLLKLGINLTLVSGETPAFWFASSNLGLPPNLILSLAAGNNIYYKAMAAAYTDIFFFNNNATNWSAINSLKRVTDPPATGCHIVSALNGTTRSWNMESGFDPNTIASWKVNSVVPKSAIGWYLDDVDDRIVHPSINFGTTHTLLYWLRSFANAKDIIHGGAANYHVAIDGTNLYYNAGATELSQAHGGGIGNSTMIGIARSGTTVQFFKNGIQVGANQTLDANNDLALTTLGSYDTPGTFMGGVIQENIGFNTTKDIQEIRNYYELTRLRYGA